MSRLVVIFVVNINYNNSISKTSTIDFVTLIEIRLSCVLILKT